MRLHPSRAGWLASIAVTFALLTPSVAFGQFGARQPPAQRTFGIGPRLSFVRVDPQPDTTRERYFGGQVRAWLGDTSAIEMSIDYRSYESVTERVRDYPLQASLMVYPVRAAISTYLLGGIGWYSRRVDQLAGDNVVSETTRPFGYHGGLGGELRLGSRASIYLDYRYTKLHVGDEPPGTTEPGVVPIPGLGGLQEKLKLSHEGSMWTTGLTYYF